MLKSFDSGKSTSRYGFLIIDKEFSHLSKWHIKPVESSMHMESNASRIELDPVLLPPEPGVLEVCGCAKSHRQHCDHTHRRIAGPS